MQTEINLLERFIADSGSAKEAANRLGISPPTVTMYRKGDTPIGPALREKLRVLGYSNDSDNNNEILTIKNTAMQMLRKEEQEIHALKLEVDVKIKLLKEKEESYQRYKVIFEQLDNVSVKTLRHITTDANEETIQVIDNKQINHPAKKQ